MESKKYNVQSVPIVLQFVLGIEGKKGVSIKDLITKKSVALEKDYAQVAMCIGGEKIGTAKLFQSQNKKIYARIKDIEASKIR